MNTDIENEIITLFKNSGLKIAENGFPMQNIDLPNKDTLVRYAKNKLNDYNEENKLEIIKEYMCKMNYFSIIDWKFIFPNLKLNNSEVEETMLLFFESIRIGFEYSRNGYEKNAFNFIHPYESYKNLKILSKNTNLVDFFSKDIKLKAIFLDNEQFPIILMKKIIKLIEDKVKSTGFIEKINNVMPKLILNSYQE